MAVPLHALSVVHPVADLEETVRFFTDVLSMPVRVRGADWAVVDNGSVSLRLVRSAAPPQLVALELMAADIDASAAQLLAEPGVERAGEVEWVSPSRKELRLAARAHGLELVLARDYDEDELAVVPPLPTSLPWTEQALDVVQTLLREVPVVFRGSARTRITERAEYLAVESGEVEVAPHHGIRAVIQVTPAFQLARLRQSLVALGLDPGQWASDFERDP